MQRKSVLYIFTILALLAAMVPIAAAAPSDTSASAPAQSATATPAASFSRKRERLGA